MLEVPLCQSEVLDNPSFSSAMPRAPDLSVPPATADRWSSAAPSVAGDGVAAGLPARLVTS
jgi:hypothetical protein